MPTTFTYVLFFFLSGMIFSYAQEIPRPKTPKEKKTLEKITQEGIRAKDSIRVKEANEIDPLRPARAAFYSAILPGLGQAFNKRYWKIPLVYAAIGTGLYFYIRNSRKYHSYREAYKLRLRDGITDENYRMLTPADEFPRLSTSSLINAQKFYQKNIDLSLFFTLGMYLLNIIDANVDAHLSQFNVNDNLSLKPGIIDDFVANKKVVGISLNIKF